jgi:uncharacterized delta-60 repeat protein
MSRGRSAAVCVAVFAMSAMFLSSSGAAPASDLDPTFGSVGTPGYWQDTNGGWVPGEAVVQSDGKILVSGGIVDAESGIFNFVLYRLTSAGIPDTTFSGDGTRTFFFGANLNFAQGRTALVQGDGRIVEVGTASGTGGEFTALVRYMPNGTLDTSFGDSGRALIAPPTGYHAGAIDAAFRPGGGILVVFGGVNLMGQTTQKWVTLALTADGALDPSWGPGGFRLTDPDPSSSDVLPDSLAIQSDGKPVVAGTLFSGEGVAVRYKTTGALDTTFNGTGKVALPQLSTLDDALALPSGALLFSGLGQPANKTVIDTNGDPQTISGFKSARILRRLSGGGADLTFGTGGMASFHKGSNLFFDDGDTGSGGLVPQSTGKLILGASVYDHWDYTCGDWTPIISRPVLARFSDTGVRDMTFSGNGLALGPADWVSDVADLVVQSSDRIVVANSVNCTFHTPVLRVEGFPAS